MGESIKRFAVVSALLCALVALVAPIPAAHAGSSSADTKSSVDTKKASRPNILLLISDDQAWSDFSPALMPSVYSQLVDQGVLFNRAYVNTSLCCPSRAQILTGLYEHNTGVDANAVKLDRPTFPQALHDSGYRTMLAGKYLNSWPCDPRAEFDQWVCVGTPEPSTYSLPNPYMNVNGVWNHFKGYQPDILADLASDFISQTPADQPFFVMYAPTTPHLPADDPRYDDMPLTPPRGDTFDANTMTPGTPLYARRQSLTPAEIKVSDSHFVTMAHAVRSLDDAVGSLVGSLGSRANDTLVIYMSDNGFLYGEHRRMGKIDPWEESVKVPMVVRYPAALPVDQAFASDALVQNVDLASTIADVAGVPWGADGRSFLPVLEHRVRSARKAALIEQCRGVSQGSLACSGIAFNGSRVETPGFEGIVTDRYKYIEYDDGSVQLIDLRHDPNETRNLAVGGRRRPSALMHGLAARLRRMMRPRLQTTIVTGPGAAIANGIASFTYFSSSRFASYRCRLIRGGSAGPWRACPGQRDVIGNLGAGHYVFQVAGVDEAGRQDRSPAARAFTVSGGAGPDVHLMSHPAASRSGTSARFTFMSTASDATFECRLVPLGGDDGWAPCDPAGTTYEGLGDGGYQFEVNAIDPVTKLVSTPGAGWFFRIDNAGPKIAFSTKPPRSTSSTHVVLRFTPLEALKGRARCAIDGRSVGCSNGMIRADNVGSGEHTVSIVARDVVGNVGVSRYSWTVDRTAPDVGIAWGPAHVTKERTASFHLWSSVSPGLFVCQLDDLPAMPCPSGPVLIGLKDGEHTLIAWSFDAAMNRSAEDRYRWTVNASAYIDHSSSSARGSRRNGEW